MYSLIVNSFLHDTDNKPQPAPALTELSTDTEDYDDEDLEESEMTSEGEGKEDGKMGNREAGSTVKARRLTESFIFVRPPPSKSNHPLNLQVQLLPPNTRAPIGITPSIERDAVESNRSGHKYASTSTPSVASFSSTATGWDKIIPLYNLQVHNVRTSTLEDTGTGAKIAKFARRGLEMVDLAALEVAEVWAASSHAAVTQRNDCHSRSASGSSKVSKTSAGSLKLPPSLPKKKGNLFGRMFKKNPDLGSAVPVSISDIPLTFASHPPTSVVESPQTTPTRRHTHHIDQNLPEPMDVPQRVLLPPTLGIQPQLHITVPTPDLSKYSSLVKLFTTNSYPPTLSSSRGRNAFVGQGPLMYVWTVKTWTKGGGGEGVFAGLLNGHERVENSGEGVEVRVEWRRGKMLKWKRRGKQRVDGIPSTTSSVDLGGGVEEQSDPGDSEAGWTCVIKVKRVASMHSKLSAASGTTLPKTKVRIMVGTLRPTQHHSNIIAMLEVAYPLPDIEVDRVRVVRSKFVTLPTSGNEDGLDRESFVNVSSNTLCGLVFSGQEIKDVVCSTGLWLAVREGFGGLGKLSRKGDGWRVGT